MKTTLTKTFAVLALASAFASCKKEDGVRNPGNFVVAVTPTASTGVADYLVTASSLDTGKVSILGNGVEQDGTYRYYLTTNNKFFSMLYGQGNPGAVTAYNIQGGDLTKISNFQTETVQAFADVDDDILLTKVPRTINAAPTPTVYTYYQVNTNTLQIAKEGTLDAMAPGNNGEIAHFSWLQQVGNKVFAPFFSIKNRNFHSDYHDQAWVAVYSYPDMTLEKTIKDDRTSFIGRYFTNGLAVVENGDTYAFSSSVSTKGVTNTDNTVSTVLADTKPAAITRIKAGTTEFDKSYYFDVEAASGNYYVTNWIYVGNNKFVAHIQPKAEKGAYTAGKELAIVDVNAKTITKVTGLPQTAEISNLTVMNYTPKNGTAYIGVNLLNSESYVYKITASNATASRGLKVEGGKITAIQHLNGN